MPNNPLGQNNMAQMLSQIKSNPVQFLVSRRLNVPQNMMNDPNAIINHLLQTKQVSQSQVNQAYQMAGQFRR